MNINPNVAILIVIGKSNVVQLYASKATTENTFLKIKYPKKVIFSSKGFWYAFLNVGPNPNKSTKVSTITAVNALLVAYQKGREDKAKTKNNQSSLVISVFRFLVNAKVAIKNVTPDDIKVGIAPTPPPSIYWAKNTTNVVIPHINQEKPWGFTSLLIISFIYGKNEMKVTTTDRKLNISL